MKSAFGVDHGKISKGLPRALKDIEQAYNAPRSLRFHTPRLKNKYMQHRIGAHRHGKRSGRELHHYNVLNRYYLAASDAAAKRGDPVPPPVPSPFNPKGGKILRTKSRKILSQET